MQDTKCHSASQYGANNERRPAFREESPNVRKSAANTILRSQIRQYIGNALYALMCDLSAVVTYPVAA